MVFNSKLVFSFLTWSDYNRFSQFKNTYNSATFTNVLKDIHTVDGTLRLEISNKNMSFCKAAETLTSKIQLIYSRMIEQADYVAKQF